MSWQIFYNCQYLALLFAKRKFSKWRRHYFLLVAGKSNRCKIYMFSYRAMRFRHMQTNRPGSCHFGGERNGRFLEQIC